MPAWQSWGVCGCRLVQSGLRSGEQDGTVGGTKGGEEGTGGQHRSVRLPDRSMGPRLLSRGKLARRLPDCRATSCRPHSGRAKDLRQRRGSPMIPAWQNWKVVAGDSDAVRLLSYWDRADRQDASYRLMAVVGPQPLRLTSKVAVRSLQGPIAPGGHPSAAGPTQQAGGPRGGGAGGPVRGPAAPRGGRSTPGHSAGGIPRAAGDRGADPRVGERPGRGRLGSDQRGGPHRRAALVVWARGTKRSFVGMGSKAGASEPE